jgi:hypothetical protein
MEHAMRVLVSGRPYADVCCEEARQGFREAADWLSRIDEPYDYAGSTLLVRDHFTRRALCNVRPFKAN